MISELLRNDSTLCTHSLNHKNINCNGVHLELISEPTALTPTLQFGVRTNASLFKDYNITIGKKW